MIFNLDTAFSLLPRQTAFVTMKNGDGIYGATAVGFSAVLAYALFVCSDYAKGEIRLSFGNSDGNLVINVCGESKMTSEESDEFVNKFASGGLYWVTPIKMLVDGNLWDLSLEIIDEVGINLNFVLPLAEAKQPFVISDGHREYIRRILRGFFA